MSHEWVLVLGVGDNAPGKSLDEVHWCRRCGMVRHSYSHNGGQDSPSYPQFFSPSYAASNPTAPDCQQKGKTMATKAEIEALKEYLESLRREREEAERHYHQRLTFIDGNIRQAQAELDRMTGPPGPPNPPKPERPIEVS